MKKSLLIFICILLFCCNNNDTANDTTGNSSSGGGSSITAVPVLKGKMIYHIYTSYESLDSEIFLYDFNTDGLECISEEWNIQHAMNAHFSPDGEKIVFMGISGETDSWDIFLYELSGTAPPVNLTSENTRDEDPKFSPDGTKIVFKKNGNIAEMDLNTRVVTLLTDGDVEYSMPYYNSDGIKLLFTANAREHLSIMLMDLSTKAIETLYDKVGVQDYYPINADTISFYYTSGYSETNLIDQVYRGYWNGQESIRLPFNETDSDYSDPYPVNNNWVVISSTRPGGFGGYDLYIANVISGEIFSMTDYNGNINTSKDELGACIFIEKK